MKIKKLEIKGFKSFPDKTTLDFKPGITGVVGPNGCGKSNVLEAIRWTMGEQRARVLRGKKMEEVIFNGSQSRKPVGMAQTRLVLANTDGMAHPSMADYEEIMISRRLFRDGESQYEINNIPCRLADVVDFFLDTGVGKNSYAIIEQGRVEMVVSSKPEDRRVLIEEAAGISRYKARREEAVKKLDLTRQNLLRISDVIDEVKRQNSSLKRQASKAQRYRDLSNRLRELDLASHACLCRELGQQAQTLKSTVDEKNTSLMDLAVKCSSDQARLEEERVKSLQIEKDLRDVLEAHHKTEIELTSARARIDRNRTALARLDESAKLSREQQAILTDQIESLKRGFAELEDQQRSSLWALDNARQELEALVSSSAAVHQSLAEESKRLDQLKEQVFGNLQETARKKNQRENLSRRSSEVRIAGDKIARESAEAEARLEQLRQQTTQLAEASSHADRECERLALKKDALFKKHKHTGYQVASIRQELGDAEKDLAAESARLTSLEEMQKDYRGYDEAVRFLMQNADVGDAHGPIHCPIAEVLEVPEKYQKAVAAALGGRLGHLVVSSPRDGIEAAQLLTKAKAGRSTFVPALPRQGEPPGDPELAEELSCLLDLVHARGNYDPLVQFLLDGWYVVEDLEHAIRLWEENAARIDMVTMQGEVIRRSGEVTGGSEDTSRSGLFETRRELEGLRARITSSEQHVLALRASLNEELSARDTLDREIEEVGRVLNETKIGSERVRKDMELVQSRTGSIEGRRKVLSLESERLQTEATKLSEEITRTEEQIAYFQSRKEELEAAKLSCAAGIEELTASTRQESRRVGEIRVQVAQLEERCRSQEREVRNGRRNLEDQEKGLAILVANVERGSTEKDRLLQDLDESMLVEQKLMNAHQARARQIAVLKSDASEIAVWVKSIEEDLGKGTKAISVLKEDLHHLEKELIRVKQTEQGLVEKIRERYNVDPRDTPVPEQRPHEEEITVIRAKLAAMGEVNLAAIAESRFVEERLSFLLEQEEDLRKAVDSLFATINKINKTTRERFREAFDNINARFQEIFPFLFRGGEARLELTDDYDVLTAGVEIVARPFGKTFQSMHLLSGGEKALTAVALIFSIFLTRPSPFCLLDEVDAPLDDANLARFNEMLRKLSSDTQFIVVTHNKRSMAAADRLYGVTMEEPGVSSVVSVEFKD